MCVKIITFAVYNTYRALKHRLIISLMSASVFICGCEDIDRVPDRCEEATQVGLMVGGDSWTRTAYEASINNFVWHAGDELAVWAKSSSGKPVLDNQVFRLLASGKDGTSAYFTSTIGSVMEKDTYSYYVTYPVPESVTGNNATFRVPAVQDGTASSGLDILLSGPVPGPELVPIGTGSPVGQDNVLKVRMKHLLHFLRFYIPKGYNALGEPVRRIEFTMPRPLAGVVSVDVTDASSASLVDGVGKMVLDLKDPVDESVNDGEDFALAAIFPPEGTYSLEDQMAVTVYSENKWSTVASVSLAGRDFAAGHITRVPLKPVDARPIVYELSFVLDSNNLGEDVRNIRVILPEDEVWPGENSSALKFSADGDVIKVGDTFVFSTQDKSFFKGLSSKLLTVEYESESAIVSEKVALGDLSGVMMASCSLNCPYLFFEDFSQVPDISSYDDYSMSNPGSRDPVTFLGGWSAARVGAQAGTAIRLACRRETSADYPARADSPALSGLKYGVTVGLEVSFDYSMNRDGYATWPFSVPEISQTVHVGYITTPDALKSGDDQGVFPVDFTINETTGSYTNIDHGYSAVLNEVKNEADAPLRLSWRTTPEHKAGTSNNTCWLYMDNIKVKIKK